VFSMYLSEMLRMYFGVRRGLEAWLPFGRVLEDLFGRWREMVDE
jgi:hypothetical protein